MLGPATGNRHQYIKWPARSPDLTPLDYFYWPHLKNQLYQHQAEYGNLDELRAKVLEISREITEDQIKNAINSYEKRLFMCLDNDGNHFEQLLHRKTVNEV